MTAEEARNISDKYTKHEIKHSLEEVYMLIAEEAKKGLLTVRIGNIGENTAKQLIDDGFDVSWARDRENDYTIYFNIRWQIV